MFEFLTFQTINPEKPKISSLIKNLENIQPLIIAHTLLFASQQNITLTSNLNCIQQFTLSESESAFVTFSSVEHKANVKGGKKNDFDRNKFMMLANL